MRRFTVVGVLLLVVGFGAVGVSAFADNTVWLCGGNPITGTGNNRCLIVGENLEVFFMEDRGAIAAARIECAVGAVTDEGWVGPGSEDETTGIHFAVSSCKKSAKALNLKEEEVENKCGTIESLTITGLPWKTLIELEAGVAWDKLLTATAGYGIKCSGITDTCTNAGLASVRLENLALEGAEFPLVSRRFPNTEMGTRAKNSKEFAKCSLGGTEQGFIRGELLGAAVTAGGAFQTLEISTEP